MELSERKLRILHSIIDNYINTAMPVGSKAIAAELNMVFSSATIRNDMNDLEQMGFLEQPHTSAGRVPSERAYRLYVDNMLGDGELTAEEAAFMDNYFKHRIGQTEQVMQNAVNIISSITKYTAMVMPPQYSDVTIQNVQLVSVGIGKALVILVTDVGHWSDNVISVPDDADNEYLFRLSNMLTRIFGGQTLGSFNDMALEAVEREMSGQREAFQAIMDTIRKHTNTANKNDIVLSGVSNMLDYPEYRDIDKAKGFLQTIETKEVLYEMLSRNDNMEISVMIGSENPIDAMRDCSVVTATYKINGIEQGKIGVIGPTRMNYAKVVKVLDYLGKSLREIVEDKEE